MKKMRFLALTLATILALTGFGAVSFAAGAAKTVELDVAGDKPGYKISVPGFIESKKVTAYDPDGVPVETDVIVAELPKKNADGLFTVFEIVTTDAKAASVSSFPGSYDSGQLGNFDAAIVGGKVAYTVKFNLVADNVYMFDFFVQDAEFNTLFSSGDVNFMFVDSAGSGGNAETGSGAGAGGTTQEPPKAATASAKPTASKVTVDGKPIAFEAYMIGDSNYFKLRDLAMALNGSGKSFAVGWNAAENAISLETGKAYEPAGGELKASAKPTAKTAKTTNSKIFVDGQEISLTAYNIDGSNYFKLRDIAKAVDFAVTWDAKASTVGLDSSSSYTE